MTRRRLLLALAGAALVGPMPAVAHQPAWAPRIGLLMVGDRSTEAVKLEVSSGVLEKLGYIVGQTIQIELRYAIGPTDRFAPLARELIALTPSVIACVGRQEASALK